MANKAHLAFARYVQTMTGPQLQKDIKRAVAAVTGINIGSLIPSDHAMQPDGTPYNQVPACDCGKGKDRNPLFIGDKATGLFRPYGSAERPDPRTAGVHLAQLGGAPRAAAGSAVKFTAPTAGLRVEQRTATRPQKSFEIEPAKHSVDIWLTQWLPFEPKGEMLLARSELQNALKQLHAPPLGLLLSATYCSRHDSRGDVENVLFYNVGSGAFSRVAGRGLRFERLHCAPPVAPSGRSFDHHQRYAFTNIPERPTRLPAAFFEFELDGISSSTKPHDVWWAATVTSAPSSGRICAAFELYIELGAPNVGNATSIVKPLLDGIVCSMHTESNPEPEAVQRLSRRTGWQRDEVEARLRAPACPVLGARDSLVRSYRDFVMWNPADDLCEACTVLLKPSRKTACSVWVFARQSVDTAAAR